MARHKLRNTRAKALFGADGAAAGAAILAAAGINVAGQMAAAKINSNAATKAAKTQADATIKSAQANAQALQQQNMNNNQLQTESQAFTKEQNEESRQLQKDIQMNLQMLTGAQSAKDRREESKIQVKNGGLARRKRRLAYSLLRGSNMPFTVTDGGGVIPIGQTPEGFNLYEVVGNDHEHYHKAQGGKNKTGVGFKFADGSVVEGEGNQNSNIGELMLTTPNDAWFISKHSIAGFNPTKAVLQGMNPLQAIAMQEQIKAVNGISDDGKSNYQSPVKKNGGMQSTTNILYPYMIGDTKMRRAFRGDVRNAYTIGGNVIDTDTLNNYAVNPDFNTDTITPTVTGIAYAVNNGMLPTQVEDDTQAKNGKRIHRTMRSGGGVNADNGWYQFAGAGVNSLGSLGAGLISTIGNNRAAGYLSNAYNQAGNILANAYNSLTGVDMSTLRKEDYAAAHAMAAIRSANVNVNPQLEGVYRDTRNQMRAVNRNTLSSAARLNRLARLSDTRQQRLNEIYANQANQEEQIKQQNAKTITDVANENANRDTEANKAYQSAYLNLLQYNNDIANTRILGSAQSQADALTQGAGAIAQARTANANTWAGAINNIGTSFGNAFTAVGKQNTDIRNTLVGAEQGNVVNALTNGIYNDKEWAEDLYEQFRSAYNPNDNSSDNKLFKARANRLASAYGFEKLQ